MKVRRDSVEPEPIRESGAARPDPGGIEKCSETGDDPEFPSLAALLAAHLKPAPATLQAEARRVMLIQAREFAEKVRATGRLLDQGDRSYKVALQEIDEKFSQRLRELCAERLARGEGLLAVGDVGYQSRIRGRKYLLWMDGRRQWNRTTDVLVVIDEPDPELERLDLDFKNLRSVQLAEALIPFNGLPYDVRSARVREFLESRAKGRPDARLFGVEAGDLDLLEIDPNNMVVTPR